MEITVREEEKKDYNAVFELVRDAFVELPISDGDECFLVNRLRKSRSFIPELSLVAETEGKLIGHILLTEAIIKSNTSTYPTLTLAPVSVHPGWQRMGVGSRLIHDVLEIACSIGFTSVIVVGHPDYYPRFGFSLASTFGIFSPFEVPDEAFMALELVPDALKNVSGTVIYPNEFFNP